MSKNELRDGIIALLAESGLDFDSKVKAIAEARIAIQPRMSQGDWRGKAKVIERPSGGIFGKSRRQSAEKEDKSR
jgi:hypothetical protein